MFVSCKSLLNEFSQKQHHKSPPIYSSNTDEHSKFTASVTIDGTTFASVGNFSKKKQAEESAAKVACSELGLIPRTNVLSLEKTDNVESCGKEEETRTSVNEHVAITSRDFYNKEGKKLSQSDNDSQNNQLCSQNLQREVTAVNKDSKAFELLKALTPQPEIPFKSFLNEKAQKCHLNPPIYNTYPATNHRSGIKGFMCEVTLNCETYHCPNVTRSKKRAEHLAAKVCLDAMDSLCWQQSNNSNQPIQQELSLTPVKSSENLVTSSETPERLQEGNVTDLNFGYKSLLQEHLQQRGLASPIYTSIQDENGHFISFCEIEGQSVKSNTPRTRKKQSQQDAAREGLIHMGIKDPEQVFLMRSGKNLREVKIAKRRLVGDSNIVIPSSLSSWIHSRQDLTELTDDSFSEDNSFDLSAYSSFDPSKNSEFLSKDIATDHKISGSDDGLKLWNSIEPTYNDVPINQLPDLSVGELWPEKCIFMVGNSSFSIPMKCAGRTNEIFCLREKKNVKLEAGAHIQGLVCKYHLVGSNLYLKAECCEQINYPPEPLPVLLSCGIIFLHFDPLSSEPLQIVLKRYLNSPAFIHVSAALAQWFRRRVSNRPITLDVQNITQNIQEWLSEEVEMLSNINENSMRKMFSKTWQFKNSWLKIINNGLPEDLLNLQTQCRIELERRRSMNINTEDKDRRPWNLPKGNFKHRLLTTGVFFESGQECACREMREETGISLKFTEIENCPHVDVPYETSENLNPHKGDFVRFYIYLHRAIPSITNKDANSENTKLESSSTGVSQTERNLHGGAKSFTQTVKRGTKRKRENNSDSLGEIENKRIMTEIVEEGPHARDPSTRFDESACDEEESLEESMVSEADRVRTTINEECTWQSVDMALKNSQVFQRIYQATQFQTVLEELRKEQAASNSYPRS